jgi:hypothetical protein
MPSKTSIYEEFLLATDKEAYLNTIKTTNEYKELVLHYNINQGKPVPDQFATTVTHRGETKFALKKQLVELESETDPAKKTALLQKINADFLRFSFNHQRANGNRQVAGKQGESEEVLNSKLTSYVEDFSNVEKLIAGFYAQKHAISSFNSIGRHNLHKIDVLKLQNSQS